METLSLITCPNCQHKFSPEQAYTDKIRENLRTEFNGKFKGLMAQKEAEMQKLLQEEQAKMLAKEKEYEAKLKENIKADFEQQLKHSQEEIEAKRKELIELKNRELEFLKREQILKEQQQNFELDMQKKLLEERKVIEDMAKQKADAENLLRIKEKDMKLEQLMEQLEIMKKKAEQGSMQLQGEVQEIALEELLKASFPFDNIAEVGKGVKGADIVQTVRNHIGNDCGTIIYESKRTKNFQNEWIDKLKSDLRSQKADLAVIVTETMPKDMERFGQKEGVWICSFNEVRGVAAVLRESLIRISEAKSSQENKGDKMQLLYDFLTGNEFQQHIESVVEGFTSMQQSIMKERMQMEKLWSEREKQLQKVLLNMSGMYGSIKGIAGNAIAEVKVLEIGE